MLSMIHFAHEGVEHGSTAEAIAHTDKWPIILSVSFVAIVAIIVTSILLKAAEKPDKNKETKK